MNCESFLVFSGLSATTFHTELSESEGLLLKSQKGEGGDHLDEIKTLQRLLKEGLVIAFLHSLFLCVLRFYMFNLFKL